MLSNTEFKAAVASLDAQMQKYEHQGWNPAAILKEMVQGQTLQDVMDSLDAVSDEEFIQLQREHAHFGNLLDLVEEMSGHVQNSPFPPPVSYLRAAAAMSKMPYRKKPVDTPVS